MNHPEREFPIGPTQLGRLNKGERLSSPHGTWTVAESWVASEYGAQGKDRDYAAVCVVRGSGSHVYYLLTREDGHEEEWSAPDMAEFHRIFPSAQQTLA